MKHQPVDRARLQITTFLRGCLRKDARMCCPNVNRRSSCCRRRYKRCGESSHPLFSISAPVLLSLRQTETVWLHLNMRFECVFNLRRQEQIYGLTVFFTWAGRILTLDLTFSVRQTWTVCASACECVSVLGGKGAQGGGGGMVEGQLPCEAGGG